MELQVRLSYETAQLLEQLKEEYEDSMGIKLTKSDVLMKSVADTVSMWENTDWENLEITRRDYDITKSSLRPKFQISNETNENIEKLRKILSTYLGLQRYVTLGVAIKYVLNLSLYNLTKENEVTINTLLYETVREFEENEKDELKILHEFVNEFLLKLEKNDML